MFADKRSKARQVAAEDRTQAERKALRRTKKRVHKRKTAEKGAQQKLDAALHPTSAAAKQLDKKKVDQQLADFKRKGKAS